MNLNKGTRLILQTTYRNDIYSIFWHTYGCKKFKLIIYASPEKGGYVENHSQTLQQKFLKHLELPIYYRIFAPNQIDNRDERIQKKE